MGDWQEFEQALRDRLNRAIEAQPEYLLEHDGGPEGLHADIYLATLIGVDDQIDAEWRIPRAEHYLLMPRRQRVTLSETVDPNPSLPVARYDLQSNYATMQVDWLAFKDLLPLDVKPKRGDYLVTVALLRYRRRIEP